VSTPNFDGTVKTVVHHPDSLSYAELGVIHFDEARKAAIHQSKKFETKLTKAIIHRSVESSNHIWVLESWKEYWFDDNLIKVWTIRINAKTGEVIDYTVGKRPKKLWNVNY